MVIGVAGNSVGGIACLPKVFGLVQRGHPMRRIHQILWMAHLDRCVFELLLRATFMDITQSTIPWFSDGLHSATFHHYWS